MDRIGILGGTFNPPHVAHLVCAQEAAARLELHRVLLMPVAAPPHKRLDEEPGPEVRLELCRLAAAGDPRLEVSDLEVARGGPSYTVDTLAELHERRPGDQLTWIAGGDMAASLPSWREPERVLSFARLAVAEREGAARAEIERVVESLGGSEAVTFLDMPRIDVSSSLVRRRVAAGLPIRYLVPDAVAAYIAEHGLYRSAVTAS
ncbi:MAG: nicotinate-nucleotide adenylyltransferase [Actinomycetota bacterium]|nr:nicotinate-nucleotide adenylyltransferase [Actinomycetota bacterium]